jgi:hypothetical protein
MSPRWVHLGERLKDRRWLLESLELRTAPSDMLLLLGAVALGMRPGDAPRSLSAEQGQPVPGQPS